MSNNENKNPSIKLRHYRIKAGYTQNALAKEAGISQSHISEIESGVKRVGLDISRKLARVLGCTIDDLISDEEPEEESLEELEREIRGE